MNPRSTLFAALFLAPLFLGAAPPGTETLPAFRPLYSQGAEYELDRFMGDFPWDWRDSWRGAENAFLATGGSLNIRHFFIDQRLKVRFPLMDGRLWFRVRQERLQGLERDDREFQIEFEGRAASCLFLSLLGEPTGHKSESTAGVAARWGEAEGRSLKLAYLWPGFDTNYAFHNRSVNEGLERFYRRYPQEARLTVTFLGEETALHVEGRLMRPWELQYQGFTDPADRRIAEGAKSEALADLRHRWEHWTAALEGSAWRMRESLRHEPGRAGDRTLRRERNVVRAFLERELSPAWRLRGGLSAAINRGREISLSGGAPRGERIEDRIIHLTANHRPGKTFQLETGLLFDRQRYRVGEKPSGPAERRWQNALRLFGRWDLGTNASLRAGAIFEMDGSETEPRVPFDGGTVQFYTRFGGPR